MTPTTVGDNHVKFCPFKAFNSVITGTTLRLLSYKSLFVPKRVSSSASGVTVSLMRYFVFHQYIIVVPVKYFLFFRKFSPMSLQRLHSQVVDSNVELDAEAEQAQKDKKALKDKKRKTAAEALEVILRSTPLYTFLIGVLF